MTQAASSDLRLPQSATGPEEARVAAVVVVYHLTDSTLLGRLLDSLVGQVATVFIVDNSPVDQAKVNPVPEPYRHCVCHIALGDNTGVAHAQNVGIQKAIEEKHTHVLLLDHDSALPRGMVEKLLSAEAMLRARGERVAAVGPAFLDEKTGQYAPAMRHGYIRIARVPIDVGCETPAESDYIISSGTLLTAEAFQVVGPMRDELYIDWIDIEWCLRARHHGYKSFICPGANMSHSVGDDFVKAFGRTVSLHSNDARNYYIVRNAVWLLRSPSMPWRWKTTTAVKIPGYLMFYSLYSRQPLRCLLLLLRALRDGCAGKLGRLA